MLGTGALGQYSVAGLAPDGVVPGVLIRHGDKYLGRQQLPDHPRSVFRPGIQGPNVRPPNGEFLLIRQQLPDHPRSIFRAGIQGPNVHTPAKSFFFTTQEVPFHPRSTFRAGKYIELGEVVYGLFIK